MSASQVGNPASANKYVSGGIASDSRRALSNTRPSAALPSQPGRT